MMKQILVPLDGSKAAEAILIDVQRIASVRDSVHLLHLLPALPAPVGLEPTHVLAMQEQGYSYLEVTRDRHLPEQRGLSIVATGDPAEGILKVALEKNIDLIAMSTHGRGGMARLLLGSVAARVVRETQLPVLLTRPDVLHSSRAVQRILVAIDGTESSKDLIETVKSLAGGLKAEIILFHAVPEVQDPAPQWAPQTSLSLRSTPEHGLQELADQLEAQGFTAWPLVANGEPVASILTQVEKQNVDVVAMSTQGRSGLDRLLAGSVAEGVLQKSPVAVLLQKPLVVRRKPALLGEKP
jgi:nucleotide-binding universal stress UspA family protein